MLCHMADIVDRRRSAAAPRAWMAARWRHARRCLQQQQPQDLQLPAGSFSTERDAHLLLPAGSFSFPPDLFPSRQIFTSGTCDARRRAGGGRQFVSSLHRSRSTIDAPCTMILPPASIQHQHRPQTNHIIGIITGTGTWKHRSLVVSSVQREEIERRERG